MIRIYNSAIMKKTIILLAAILLISEDCNSQWYQKYFNVNDPSLLSQEQVNMALNKSKENLTIGIGLTIIGSLGIAGGVFLTLKDYPDDKYPEQAEMGKKFTGVLLTLVSIPPEIIGISVIKKNRLRKSEIEKYMNSLEMNLVITGHNGGYLEKEKNIDLVPGLSLTFRF